MRHQFREDCLGRLIGTWCLISVSILRSVLCWRLSIHHIWSCFRTNQLGQSSCVSQVCLAKTENINYSIFALKTCYESSVWRKNPWSCWSLPETGAWTSTLWQMLQQPDIVTTFSSITAEPLITSQLFIS